MSGHYWVRRRRPKARLFVIVIGLGLALIGLAQLLPNRHSIEDDLTARSKTALSASGIDGVAVSFTGRDGTLTVPDADEVDRAADVVRHIEGVRVVSAHAATQPGAAFFRTPTVMVVLADGRAIVTGAVPTDQVRTALIAGFAGLSVQDSLTLDPGVTDAAVTRLPAVVKALGNDKATVTLRDGRITLTGTVASASVRATANAAATTAVGANNVDNHLAVVAGGVQADLSGLPRVTFESGSATLTATGRAAVAKAAAILKAHPAANVRVEGHTDSNGSDANNVTLSRARAKTVVDTLIAMGIPAQRLSSIGYGESAPLVPDTTPANQAINRRVEFVVLG
jgi:outer membrane protein OmpA-like peptidoglycan-associated protein